MQDGSFPLISASQEGHDRVVEKLLQAGATVDLQNKVVKLSLFVHLSPVIGHVHIHCTLSTTQHSGECEGHRTYPTQLLNLCIRSK